MLKKVFNITKRSPEHRNKEQSKNGKNTKQIPRYLIWTNCISPYLSLNDYIFVIKDRDYNTGKKIPGLFTVQINIYKNIEELKVNKKIGY